MRTARWRILAAATLSIALTACGSTAAAGPGGANATSNTTVPPPHVVTGPTPAPTAGAGLRVVTLPIDGPGAIYNLITGAKRTVDLTMYELRDQAAEDDLVGAAARGINVRVILDQHLEKTRNTPAYDYLEARGVHVVWAPAGTTYHQKTLTVDRTTAAIMTLNLVTEDYPLTRDFAVIDTIPADVAAIGTTFDADYAHQPITPPDGTDLVWSPTNATTSILDTINGATRTLAIENEEMSDTAVTDALETAARRGVNVEITMTADSDDDTAFASLTAAGAHIHLYPDSDKTLYIHAKAIVADSGQPDQRVLVGSTNFSIASTHYNRELNVDTTNPTVVATINSTLAGDYAGGTTTHRS